MFHSDIELQAIADAHQEELRSERYCTASTRGAPIFLSNVRRYLGLALIWAGETIAGRRPSRPNPNLQTAPASSSSRFAS